MRSLGMRTPEAVHLSIGAPDSPRGHVHAFAEPLPRAQWQPILEEARAKLLDLVDDKRCRAIWRAGLIGEYNEPADGARCSLPAGHEDEHK